LFFEILIKEIQKLMSSLAIRSNFGLIGEDLELKKDVSININEEGRISDISYEEITDLTKIFNNYNTTILIPGLINSHVHIGDSFAKEFGFNKSLIEVVAPPDGIKHKLLKGIDSETIKTGIKKAALEMLSSGTTLFIDYRENGIKGIRILEESLEDISIRRIILGRPYEDDNLELILREADGLGFASYNQISNVMKKKLKLMKDLLPEKIISCHDAELEKLDELFEGIIKDGLIDVIIHGTHYKLQSLKLLKKNGIALVLCPRSNGYFGVGFPPIAQIIKLRIPVSIGTDNVMINNLDLFEELRYLYRIYRVLEKDRLTSLLSSKELLKMITVNAARNFKIQEHYGSISKGKFADFFEVNLDAVNFYCEYIDKEHLCDLLVQRIKQNNIKKVYIGGKIAYERK
jgi:cytosine/adenosine deaminase-related metal-dependent hydrolase